MARLRCVFVAYVLLAAALRLPGDAIASRGHHGPAAHDYRDALAKSILFFEGQRSGKLPPSQRMSWRRDSGLSDGASAKVDLVGGYHDAGDNVKFGFPMAFSMTMLAWSVVEFGGLMKSELPHARDAVRWGADFLLKATAHPDTIYVQVGDATKDHACWERPEDMDTPRTVYKVDASTPGSDVAAETAAALAAASLVFRKSDPAYASRLVARAKRVFQFADKHRGAYSTGLAADVCPFYCSYSGYQDELLWGAAWLHRATKSPTYLSYIQTNGQVLGADESDNTFGWDSKHAGAQVLIAKSFLVQRLGAVHEYKAHADGFICSMVPGTATDNTQYTRGGLLFRLSDSNMQYVTSSAFLLLTYAKYLAFAKATVRCSGCAPSRAGRWTTCWGATRRGCRTWSGTAPGTRAASTTARRRCRPWRRTRAGSGARRGSPRCTRAAPTRTCSSAPSSAGPTCRTGSPTRGTTTSTRSRPPTSTRRSSARSPTSRTPTASSSCPPILWVA